MTLLKRKKCQLKGSRNMNIKEIEQSNNNYVINEVVDIHMAAFRGFFLTFMGKGFLKVMYKCYCEFEKSGLIGAFDDNGDLVGFLAFSGDMSGLYKYMIKKKLLLFGWYSVLAFFRKPKIFIRLLRAFLKPGESNREEKYIELSSIGVNPDSDNKGVGTQLISYLKDMVDFSEYEYINLETDAVDNEKANKFYLKNGFILTRMYETAEKRKMNEYRFYKNGKEQI